MIVRIQHGSTPAAAAQPLTANAAGGCGGCGGRGGAGRGSKLRAAGPTAAALRNLQQGEGVVARWGVRVLKGESESNLKLLRKL
jgi:hypothetical protein